MKLTRRGKLVAALSIPALTWLASAIGYWITGVPTG